MDLTSGLIFVLLVGLGLLAGFFILKVRQSPSDELRKSVEKLTGQIAELTKGQNEKIAAIAAKVDALFSAQHLVAFPLEISSIPPLRQPNDPCLAPGV